MSVYGERDVRAASSASSKLDDIARLEQEEQFLTADDFELLGKISRFHYSDTEDESMIDPSISFRSISAISMLNETRETLDTGRYDTPLCESNMTSHQPLDYSALHKHRNPYSHSINNGACIEKSSNARENVHEDEPHEGRAKQSVLLSCREYLANYQESCGTPRTEYSYAALITVMAQATARSLWALMYVFINVAPVVQMFSFILRFVLDKVINIRRTRDVRQTIVKSAILVVQLLSVYICLVFILGFIVAPIVQMAVNIAAKFATRD